MFYRLNLGPSGPSMNKALPRERHVTPGLQSQAVGTPPTRDGAPGRQADRKGLPQG
jgi:hypothetical protein